MTSPHVVEYKGYQIEVRIERLGSLFATWQVRLLGQDALVGNGAIAGDWLNQYDVEVAAVGKARAWIDQQAT